MLPFGRCRCPFVVTIAIMLLARGSAAQEPSPTATDTTPSDTTAVYRLEPVRATVTRGGLEPGQTPFSVAEVVQIRRGQAALGLDEPLALVPGLQVENRHNLALGTRVSARGLGARAAFGVRGVRILVDGIPLTLPDGQSTLTNLDLSAAGRIQVIRGPASVLYGNAAGGVVAVETREPPPEGLQEARVLRGNYGAGSGGGFTRLEATVGKGAGRTSYVISASHLALAGYRRHSAADRTGLIARLRHALGPDGYLTVVVNAAFVPHAQSPGSVPADTLRIAPTAAWPGNVATGSGEEARQLQAGVTLTRHLSGHRVDLTVWGAGREVASALPFAFIDLGRWTGGARATVRRRLEPLGRPLHLSAGFDVELQRDDRQERDNVGGQPGTELRRDRLDRVTGFGPFIQGQLALTDALELRSGVRYDAVRFGTTDRVRVGDRSASRTLGAWSVSSGVLVRLGGGLAAFGNLATGFQTPTTTELINAPPEEGEPCCPSGFNPDLEPQRARSLEAGFRLRSAYVTGEVVAYTMRVDDALVPFQVPGGEGREFYRNAGRTWNRGIEVAAGIRPAPGLSLDAAYARTHVVVRDDGSPQTDHEGNLLPGVAPRHLVLRTEYARAGSFATVELDAVGRYPVDDANTAFNPPDASANFPFDGYTILDVRAGTRFAVGNVEVAPLLALENALDVRHAGSVVVNAFGGRYYEPAPGRTILMGARLAWLPASGG